MEEVLAGVIVLAGIFLAAVYSKRWFPVDRNRLKSIMIPDNLGVKPNLGLEPLAEKLEKAWNEEYADHVKLRVLEEGKVTSADYDWYELELKRFFMMSSLLKNVPMYNDSVDEIWHEMLMFTKNYETFSNDFAGEYIHHQPNVSKDSSSEEFYAKNNADRAWFEWIYTNLFEWSPNTEIIYGPFKFHLDQAILLDIETSTMSDLLTTRFKPKNKEAEAAVELLISKMKNDIYAIKNLEPSNYKINLTKNSSTDPLMLQTMLFTSYYGIENQEIEKEMVRSKCSGWSSCTVTYSSDKHDKNHQDQSSCRSNHSCSGSSCSSSSCGSSCGSS
ncbi:hypothetical protein JOC77_000769 [Peribacillus deserti]|uniref:Uncharacterized protein n=1 Tax=Peribacillus deserti TaxID=673318 RepID=A0ABS2QEW1_9BACI|nr:hypothetical protein [Peribacillus deserti]MBM7691364.1 hypothetical protein [Peribacillus deserti]